MCRQHRVPVALLLCAACWTAPAAALNLGQCDQSLGMESGEIADSQITASSSHNENSVGPHSGRIRTEHRGGAWCPLPVITAEVREYLQVDLGRVTVVTAAETQGRFGNGRGVEWAERYSLQYWRPGTGWRTYRNASGHTLLDGNVNSYLAHKTPLDPPMMASKVRLVPRSEHPRTVCLRAELHGCPYTDGIDSYSMDLPDPKWPDLTYDGVRSAEIMEKGLGQLADGRAGTNDITRPEWVGWQRRPGQLVNITFRFSSLRELETASFHVSNRFTAGVKLFSLAALFFSLDGQQYTESAVTLAPEPDRIFEDSRLLEVSLHRQVARFVRIQLTAADSWLLISEIGFSSAVGASLLAAVGAGCWQQWVLACWQRWVLALVVVGASLLAAVGAGLLAAELRLNMQLAAGPGYARAHGDTYGPLPADEDKVGLCGEPYRVVRLNADYDTAGQRGLRGRTPG
ncbi:discoidin domain-containing receptor tyrosine kinase B-like [Pollicipes pollicipes]|uniref:discoidin domain-containing receptor tyrosine kinase B-like n=1 Tax=Pollicipes pollicipes TaxID=41117 RepID=UPI001884F48E|nr:discoidin domain-containing receptor tyrosine kinase B-like [Pollicipes pollicipes]